MKIVNFPRHEALAIAAETDCMVRAAMRARGELLINPAHLEAGRLEALTQTGRNVRGQHCPACRCTLDSRERLAWRSVNAARELIHARCAS